ncbi:MAG: formyltransferase family protein, partial [Cypionkella sp.]
MTESSAHPISTLLIGNESLTQECGTLLLAHGHQIAAVVTQNAELQKWAHAKGLRVQSSFHSLEDLSVDWLFSIANLEVIPGETLARAKVAVNFHDGPLPRYAGLNAPVWAIMNGESQFGISWHVIEGGIDEGDLLEQRLFDITATETALTLNSRCFEAALDSFPAVLAQLESGHLQRKPQDLTKRSLCKRYDRPANFGLIDFDQTVETVARRVQALDHGQYWNPLTTPKISLDGQVWNVGSAQSV